MFFKPHTLQLSGFAGFRFNVGINLRRSRSYSSACAPLAQKLKVNSDRLWWVLFLFLFPKKKKKKSEREREKKGKGKRII